MKEVHKYYIVERCYEKRNGKTWSINFRKFDGLIEIATKDEAMHKLGELIDLYTAADIRNNGKSAFGNVSLDADGMGFSHDSGSDKRTLLRIVEF